MPHVVAAAKALCERYNGDVGHGTHVAELSLAIFDTMQREHRLSPHERLLMEVSAILHEIGQFVNQSGHHKHGQYLVENAEIFGLDRDDRQIVGNVVRYHRKALPSKSHPYYMSLTREQRLVVSKLAAILRVADALDRGHARRMSGPSDREDRYRVGCCTAASMMSASSALVWRQESDLFEQVFGLRAVLRD